MWWMDHVSAQKAPRKMHLWDIHLWHNFAISECETFTSHKCILRGAFCALHPHIFSKCTCLLMNFLISETFTYGKVSHVSQVKSLSVRKWETLHSWDMRNFLISDLSRMGHDRLSQEKTLSRTLLKIIGLFCKRALHFLTETLVWDMRDSLTALKYKFAYETWKTLSHTLSHNPATHTLSQLPLSAQDSARSAPTHTPWLMESVGLFCKRDLYF